jgi:hypothetical protein
MIHFRHGATLRQQAEVTAAGLHNDEESVAMDGEQPPSSSHQGVNYGEEDAVVLKNLALESKRPRMQLSLQRPVKRRAFKRKSKVAWLRFVRCLLFVLQEA